MSGTIDNWRGIPLTDWFDVATQQPTRAGVYQAQDHTMRCGHCWFDAHWNGREWHTGMFDFEVKRWRGLAQRPNVGAERRP